MNEKQETRFIVLVCVAAAIRIFVFASAFPFFNNVDEWAHVDTVLKYARGYQPKPGANRYDPETIRLIITYGSNEYYRHNVPAPLWKCSKDSIRSAVLSAASYWNDQKNHEALAQPVYYLAAGLWYDLGKFMGIKEGISLYWIRYLNVLTFTLFVFLSYLYCKTFFPEKPMLKRALPVFLVFFPQDLYYSVTNDTLSCFLFLLSFYWLSRIYMKHAHLAFYVMTGLSVSVTVLTKFMNAPLLLLAAVILFAKRMKIQDDREKSVFRKGCWLFSISALLPVLLWLGWNAWMFGNISGQPETFRENAWTLKPIFRMFDHPIFTFSGVRLFTSELFKTFWRGEFIWHDQRLNWGWMDKFYLVTSFVFLVASAIQWITLKKSVPRNATVYGSFQWLVFSSFVGVLAILSIVFQFGEHWMPSTAFPYFAFGRYMTGGLFSFAVLYLSGLGWILSRISRRGDLLLYAVGLILFLIVLSEIWMSIDAFRSPYNFFHLIRG